MVSLLVGTRRTLPVEGPRVKGLLAMSAYHVCQSSRGTIFMVEEVVGNSGESSFRYYVQEAEVDQSLKVAELKQRCIDAGMNDRGSKNTLHGRLTQYLKQGGATVYDTSTKEIQKYSSQYVRVASIWLLRSAPEGLRRSGPHELEGERQHRRRGHSKGQITGHGAYSDRSTSSPNGDEHKRDQVNTTNEKPVIGTLLLH